MSVALAGALALAGWIAGWLTVDGAVAASIVGGATFAGTGVPGGVLLALFFVSGSVLTSAMHARGRGGRDDVRVARNARQVLANGGWAALGGLLAGSRVPAGWTLLAGSLAAAQADTWATETGSLSRVPPRSIANGAIVAPGTSGGITALGTAGGVIGASIFAIVAAAVGLPREVAGVALLGGVIGMVADSWLGASVQGQFFCESCAEATERRRHSCGATSRPTRGWSWLDNDGVNFLATGAGGAVAVLLSSWL